MCDSLTIAKMAVAASIGLGSLLVGWFLPKKNKQ